MFVKFFSYLYTKTILYIGVKYGNYLSKISKFCNNLSKRVKT